MSTLKLRGRTGPESLCREGKLHLSPREAEVCALVASGISYKEAAAELGMSVRTLHVYVDKAAVRLRVAYPWLPEPRVGPRAVILKYYRWCYNQIGPARRAAA